MPRIRGIPGPYVLFFYSFDCQEPMHVHVQHERRNAKFWLAPVAMAWNHGFRPHELNDVRRLIATYELAIMEAWHEHCGQP